jgi:predicted dehydrogenase
MSKFNRRTFVKQSTLAATSLSLLRSEASIAAVWSKRVQNLTRPDPVKIAILGLGSYATNWIAPAIQQAEYAELTGIISGSPQKYPIWQDKYQIPDANIYDYDNLEQIANNPEIDCVYVVTPPGNHADFAIRCLNAGKHVICEKPMARSENECSLMIQTAKSVQKSLQIGYRLYWDPFTVKFINSMRDKEFGAWRTMETGFSSRPNDSNFLKKKWRIDRAMSLGGGLGELGVYCVQSAFYLAQDYPILVEARSWTKRTNIFKEVPEHWEWELTWPDGRKSHHNSGWGEYSHFINMRTKDGVMRLEPAYSYSGNKGYTPKGKLTLQNIFQQKLQIDGQCLAIRNRRPNITSGEMGRRDIKIISAIMKSAESSEAIPLT